LKGVCGTAEKCDAFLNPSYTSCVHGVMRPLQYASPTCKWWLTWTATKRFQLGGHRALSMRISVLQPCTKFEVRWPSGCENMADFGHGIYPFGDLDLLTLELVCTMQCNPWHGPVLVLVQLFSVELWLNTRQTDDMTL